MSDASVLLLACLPRLRRYARALTGDRHRADDLVQDTMERGWQKLSGWQAGSNMRAWLFGIMHNVHVDQLRKPTLPLAVHDDDLPGASTAADEMVLRDLETALAQLPAEQREILLLVGLEQLSYAEVAETLGIPVGTVMSRLSRGRERLRMTMEGRPMKTALKVIK